MNKNYILLITIILLFSLTGKTNAALLEYEKPWLSIAFPPGALSISMIPIRIDEKFLVDLDVILPFGENGKDAMGVDFYRIKESKNVTILYGLGLYQVRYDPKNLEYKGIEVEVTDNRTYLAISVVILFPYQNHDIGLSLHSERGLSIYFKAPF